MANQRLNTTITIGGAVTAGLRSAIGSTVDSLRRIGTTIRDVQRQQRDVGAAIAANRRAGQSVQDLQRRYEELGRSIERMRRAQQRLQANDRATQANNTLRTDTGGKIVGTVAAGVAASIPFIAAAKQASDFEYQMQLIGNTASMTKPQIDELSASILKIGQDVNQSAENTQRGLGFLIAAGMKLDTARATIATVGKAATATGGDIEDMAKAAFTLNDALDIEPSKIMEAMNTLAVAGKEGNVEFRDMAKQLPVIASGMTALKMGGREAAATIGAALQIARKGAADPDEAANNMKNFIAKIMSPETLKKAAKTFNLDLYKVIADAQKAGKNPFDEAMMAIMKATKGDQKKIGELFQDMQVQNFIRPMIQNWDKYNEIKGKALGADGTIDKDFQSIMTTNKERVDQMSQAFGRLSISIGEAVLGLKGEKSKSYLIDQATEWVRANKEIVQTSVIVGASLLGLRIAQLGATYAFTLGRGAVLAAQGAYLRIGAAMTQVTIIGGRLASMYRAVAFAFVLSGAPILAVAAAGAAVVAVGFGIWKMWEPIKAFFVGFGQGLVEGFAPITAAITEAFAPVASVIGPIVMPILRTVGKWVKAAVGWFGELLTPVSAASETTKSFGEAGKACGQAVATAFEFMLKPIKLVLESIQWINNNIGGVIEKAGKLGSSLSNGWQNTKDFFTGGPGPAAAVPAMRGASPAVAGATTTNTITINQQPGQDAKALADEVAREIERRNGVKGRSRLSD